MAADGCVVVIGGNRGIGREIARHYADAGAKVVISATDAPRAHKAAGEIGGDTSGIGLDLAKPETIRDALAAVGPVATSWPWRSTATTTGSATTASSGRSLVTLKLVGYAEVVASLRDRLSDDSAIVLFGGLAKERPYPGSTTVSTVNGGIVGLTRTLVWELAPIRVNAIHPGIVEDSPFWAGRTYAFLARTPTSG